MQNETALMSCRKTSSVAQKVCGWTVWRTPRFARSNFAKPHKNWECA